MSYAIELYFDAEADARIRKIRNKFISLSASNPRAVDARPHVSLVVADQVDAPAVGRLLDRFARSTKKFSLTLASVGFFPGPASVVFLAPKVTAELLALHARFLADFTPIASDLWSYYLAAAWVPHCALAEGVAPDRLASVPSIDLPIAVTVLEIGLTEFSRSQLKQLHNFALI